MKARLESITFGDYSRYVILPNNFLLTANRNDIIDYILGVCKSFRKYGKHLNERFIIHFK